MNRTLIIAEAGVNHNGDISIAKKLIDVAAEAGADYVKFQTFKAEMIASSSAKKAEYQKQQDNSGESQVAMLKKLELSENDHLSLLNYCKEKNIQFLSTPFDLESIDLLKSFGITVGKIPSGEITNLPYIRKMAASFGDIILSTGMCTIEDIESVMKVLQDAGVSKNKITILHCNTEYPTPYSDVNLHAMQTLASHFQVNVGYSDHTMGIEVPIAAVALGATIIEKHFTLDRSMPGPDHKASLEPIELKQMVASIRNIEKALGSNNKKPSPSELKNIEVARKSIVALKPIKKGELLNETNLAVKRPGTGISPMQWDRVIGSAAIRDFEADEAIEL